MSTSAPANTPVLALAPHGVHLQLTRQEYETIQALRIVDAFKFQRERTIILQWNGVRLRVLDSTQVSL